MSEQRTSSLSRRYDYSYNTKDDGGNSGKSVMDWSKVKNGKELKFYKVRDGWNRLDFIPYIIKSPNHPMVKNEGWQVGDPDYVMDLWVHRNVGPGEVDVICPKKMWRKPCPVCELAAELLKSGKEKEAKELKATRRVFYNVIDAKAPEEGIQIFEVSHYLFERNLSDCARNQEGGQVFYADLEGGKTVKFRARDSSSGDWTEFTDFQFLDRETPLKPKLINHAISFDEALILRNAEEINKLLYGDDDDDDPKGGSSARGRGRDDDDDDDPPPRSGSHKAQKDDDDDDDPPPRSGKDKGKGKGDDDDDDDDDPPPRSGKAEAADDDDDDDDDPPPAKPEKDKGKADKANADDDDLPPAKPAAEKAGKAGKAEAAEEGKCPHGFKFGKECDDHDECEKCKQWDPCSKAGSGK